VKKAFLAVAISVATCSLSAAEGETITTAAASAGGTNHAALAAEVLKHQQQIEASVRDNTTDQISKHAQAAYNSAEKLRKAAQGEQNTALAAKAQEAATTAKELVKIGKDNTIAENSQVLMRLGDQAKALQSLLNTKPSTSAKSSETTETASASGVGQALHNTVCPVSNVGVDSMGEPVTISYKGQEVTLCCGACKDKFMENPDAHLEKARKSAKTATN